MGEERASRRLGAREASSKRYRGCLRRGRTKRARTKEKKIDVFRMPFLFVLLTPEKERERTVAEDLDVVHVVEHLQLHSTRPVDSAMEGVCVCVCVKRFLGFHLAKGSETETHRGD